MRRFFCLQQLGQPRCWRSRCLAMPRLVAPARNWMWFLDTVLIINQTSKWKACPVGLCVCVFFCRRDLTNGAIRKISFVLFLSERYDRYNDPKKMQKSDHNFSERRLKKLAGLFHLCTNAVKLKHEAKISDRNSQNWAGHRSNATCSHHYLYWCIGTVFLVLSRHGWRIVRCKCLQDCLHQLSSWSWTKIFGAVVQIF